MISIQCHYQVRCLMYRTNNTKCQSSSINCDLFWRYIDEEYKIYGDRYREKKFWEETIGIGASDVDTQRRLRDGTNIQR